MRLQILGATVKAKVFNYSTLIGVGVCAESHCLLLGEGGKLQHQTDRRTEIGVTAATERAERFRTPPPPLPSPVFPLCGTWTKPKSQSKDKLWSKEAAGWTSASSLSEGRAGTPPLARTGGPHPNANGKPAPPSEHAAAADSDGSEAGGGANGSSNGVAVSFSTNHNSVVCLPLVSEGLKLVWTQSDQTRELDSIPELVQAFNVFPYPSSREVASLARRCALPLDKVKVWFMVQRIKYGISWASEEIEETRRKLAGPDRFGTGAEPGRRARDEEEEEEEEDDVEVKEDEREAALSGPHPKCPKYEQGEPPARPLATPHFRSSLPPPQDSYYYRPPAEAPGPLDSPPRRPGRYKKSKAQLAVLRSSFLRQNWPAEAELRRLQEETGLSRNDIRKWFSDSRYQLRNGRGLRPFPGGLRPFPGGLRPFPRACTRGPERPRPPPAPTDPARRPATAGRGRVPWEGRP
ncbi:hypothetical protein SKAU_G00377880 [Synaphobranchus kaupii]|uniref:Homeobox domain-containing protein n=1 Tax=Synaphobranchus kaupii TaxID=118154 RepID=A0A9Q1ICC6_SYNKA|nr:hypothetical protein SKAU_G00377880 [Synaphobranchus kaupii]